MTLSPEAIAVITGLAGVCSTLAGVIYRQQQSRLAEKDARIAALETEAREAMKAKDLEKDEWRRMALGHVGETPR
jgi:hypothetical protein